jgi:hypothetical protein
MTPATCRPPASDAATKAHGRVDALVVNNLGDGFVDICRRDAGRLDVGSEPGIQALHRCVRSMAGHELIHRVKAVAARREQPAATEHVGDVSSGHRRSE